MDVEGALAAAPMDVEGAQAAAAEQLLQDIVFDDPIMNHLEHLVARMFSGDGGAPVPAEEEDQFFRFVTANVAEPRYKSIASQDGHP
jgi:hypothetical protein